VCNLKHLSFSCKQFHKIVKGDFTFRWVVWRYHYRWVVWRYHWRQRYRSLIISNIPEKMREYWLKNEKLFLKHDVPQHRKDRNSSRKCAPNLIRRQNNNAEVVERSWLCFSPSQPCVYCFTCGLMCVDTTKCARLLIRKGICDWKHAAKPRAMKHKHAMITFSRRCN